MVHHAPACRAFLDSFSPAALGSGLFGWHPLGRRKRWKFLNPLAINSLLDCIALASNTHAHPNRPSLSARKSPFRQRIAFCSGSLLMSFIQAAQELRDSNPDQAYPPEPLRVTLMVQLSRGPAQRSMCQDQADVVSLIRANNLDGTLADHLHPSLRRDYLGCLEEIRREEAFIARNG